MTNEVSLESWYSYLLYSDSMLVKVYRAVNGVVQCLGFVGSGDSSDPMDPKH